MDRATVLTAVIDTAVELLKLDPATVTETATWAEDLEADSLDLTELVMALEDRFDIVVEDEEFGGDIFETLGSLAGFVDGKRG